MRLVPGIVCCVLLLLPLASAVPRHDPLTPAESDQLRDTAQEPDQRLKLYVKFVRARLAAVEQVRSDPKVTDRGQETHDRLQDFLDLYDELNDNIDTYADRKEDLRKVLKPIIEADTEFEAKLRALKNSATASKDEQSHYEFLLTKTIETIENSAKDHRKFLPDRQ